MTKNQLLILTGSLSFLFILEHFLWMLAITWIALTIFNFRFHGRKPDYGFYQAGDGLARFIMHLVIAPICLIYGLYNEGSYRKEFLNIFHLQFKKEK